MKNTKTCCTYQARFIHALLYTSQSNKYSNKYSSRFTVLKTSWQPPYCTQSPHDEQILENFNELNAKINENIIFLLIDLSFIKFFFI